MLAPHGRQLPALPHPAAPRLAPLSITQGPGAGPALLATTGTGAHPAPTDLAHCLPGGRAASSPSAGGEESPGKPVPTPQMGKSDIQE